MALIYKAANFWRMDRYETFCASILSRLYVDDYTQITEQPLDHARIAVELGKLPKSTPILRRAFYDLARGAGDLLGTMASGDLIILLKLQKKLIYAWNNLSTSSSYPRSSGKCNDCGHGGRHRLNITNIRKKYPFDPLLAIQAILNKDWPEAGFCQTAETEVKEKLNSQRSEIWNSINVWIGL